MNDTIKPSRALLSKFVRSINLKKTIVINILLMLVFILSNLVAPYPDTTPMVKCGEWWDPLELFTGDDGGAVGNFIGDIGQNIVDAITGWLAGMYIGICNSILVPLKFLMTGDADYITSGVTRLNRTMFFYVVTPALIIAIIYMGCKYMWATVRPSAAQEAKEMLPKLMIAYVAAYFSVEICQFVLDFNVALCRLVAADSGYSGFESMVKTTIAGSTLSVLLLLILALTLLALLVALAVRWLFVMMAVVFMPIAILCWVIPHTREFGNKMIKLFAEATFILFFFVVAVAIVGSLYNGVLSYIRATTPVIVLGTDVTETVYGPVIAVPLIICLLAYFLLLPKVIMSNVGPVIGDMSMRMTRGAAIFGAVTAATVTGGVAAPAVAGGTGGMGAVGGMGFVGSGSGMLPAIGGRFAGQTFIMGVREGGQLARQTMASTKLAMRRLTTARNHGKSVEKHWTGQGASAPIAKARGRTAAKELRANWRILDKDYLKRQELRDSGYNPMGSPTQFERYKFLKENELDLPKRELLEMRDLEQNYNLKNPYVRQMEEHLHQDYLRDSNNVSAKMAKYNMKLDKKIVNLQNAPNLPQQKLALTDIEHNAKKAIADMSNHLNSAYQNNKSRRSDDE